MDYSATELTAQVSRVLIRYATAIDTKDWGLLATCFTLQASAEYGPRSFDRDQLLTYMSRIHRELDGSLHRITNIVATAGAAGRADAVSYVDAVLVHRAHRNGPYFRSVGSYVDELSVVDDEWRIDRREYHPLWTEGDRRILFDEDGVEPHPRL